MTTYVCIRESYAYSIPFPLRGAASGENIEDVRGRWKNTLPGKARRGRESKYAGRKPRRRGRGNTVAEKQGRGDDERE